MTLPRRARKIHTKVCGLPTATKPILRAIDSLSVKAPHEFNRLLTKPSCLIGDKTESTEFEIELIELKIKLSNETIEPFLSALDQPPSPLRK